MNYRNVTLAKVRDEEKRRLTAVVSDGCDTLDVAIRETVQGRAEAHRRICHAVSPKVHGLTVKRQMPPDRRGLLLQHYVEAGIDEKGVGR